MGASLLLDRLVRDVGGVTSSDLFPARPRDGAHDPLATLLELGRRADELAAVVGMRGPVGSLGFAVGAGRSASRAPLLANDPHMEFGLPAHFFLVHLATPELELSGATWPGVPVFWTGSNLDAACRRNAVVPAPAADRRCRGSSSGQGSRSPAAGVARWDS